MSLSIDAKKILVVAMANAVKAAEISTAIDANTAAAALSTAHDASTGVDHANVVLNDAARNTNWKIAGIMLATATDNTDAVTLGLAVGDFVVEVDQAGNLTTASGVVVYADEFLGDAAEITQVIADTRSNSVDGDYFDIDAKSGNLYRVYLDTTGGSATVPAAGGRILTEVDISGIADTAAASADEVASILNALGDFVAPATGTGTVLITDANTGLVTDAVDPGMNLLWAITTDTQGTAGPEAIDNVLIHYKPIV